MDVEIIGYDGDGFKSLVTYAGWSIAMLNANSSPSLHDINNLHRHLITNEVFILLKGKATILHAGKSKKTGKKISAVPMELYKIYNIKKGVWHRMIMQKSSKVLIVENKGTSKKNSQYSDMNKSQQEQVKKIYIKT